MGSVPDWLFWIVVAAQLAVTAALFLVPGGERRPKLNSREVVLVCAVGLGGLLSVGPPIETGRQQISFVIAAGAFVLIAARLVGQRRATD